MRSTRTLTVFGQLGVLPEQRLDALGQRCVLLKHVDEEARLLLHLRLTLLVDLMQFLAVLGVGDAVRLVAVGLARLGEQDQRRRIGRLSRECEIEEDERIDVELGPAD